MKKSDTINVLWNGRVVGRLALTGEGLCAFEYDTEWLLGGVSISPLELPLKAGVFIARPTPFEGGFGVFDDCLPDGWGLLVLDRYLQKNGIKPQSLTLLDRLSIVGSTGRGALEFYPAQTTFSNEKLLTIENLAKEAKKILQSDEYQGVGIDEFQRRGGSPGGARPKVFTKYNGKEWLVKFRAYNDPVNVGRQEYEYSLLAKKCGIEMPETMLFEDKYFGTERFDRTFVTGAPAGKLHVVSAAGLLCADYRIPSIDYLHIFKLCATLTHDFSELWKAYRLMVFNFLIGNKDDHAKNFAFIFRDNAWHFAPAFDLLPSDGLNGYHTTSINDSIEPQKSDLLAVASKSGLNVPAAKRIFTELEARLAI